MNRHEKRCLSKYYLSIEELPLLRWINLYKKHDLTQLSRTGKICKRVELVLQGLQDQIIDEFGASEDYIKVHNKKIKLELMYCEQVKTGNKSNQFFIDLLEDEIEELSKPKISNEDIHDAVLHIEKYQGVKLSVKELTVFEWHKYMKFITGQMEAEKANQEKHKLKK